MWYVAQVFTGEEEQVRDMCRKLIPAQALERCFLPYYECMKRYRGEWHKEKKILFPGYVFMITQDVDMLRDALHRVPKFTKVLGDCDCLIPLTKGEIAFLLQVGGDDQVMEMSEGYIENDRVKITCGPLTGMEGCIRKIDRHKRQARIEVTMFGRATLTTVGLEIIEKS